MGGRLWSEPAAALRGWLAVGWVGELAQTLARAERTVASVGLQPAKPGLQCVCLPSSPRSLCVLPE